MKRISKTDLKFKVFNKMDSSAIERTIETEKLLKHFDQVLEGDGDVCFVVGVPGIGKTTFVENAIKTIVNYQYL
ncbi:ATP-binding protein [Fusibacter ferrireducens]|uniref:ATP-binding protein n=1 Tax=Fusibacter ferrireducens TaxID=2785058 RepID=A0ABR9ZYP5_9FIRM|nr:ATP-binding protein [Fusibacter ferrireducens]MBF4695579.1 ATP-binding protein [Fusibacter ferrireducens]